MTDESRYQPEPVPRLHAYDDDIAPWEPPPNKVHTHCLRPDSAPPFDDQGVWAEQPLVPPVMKVTQSALRQMMAYLLSREPESAGLLLGPADDDFLITHFIPDDTGRGTSESFELGSSTLNNILKRVKPAGINCHGIAHAHPPGVPSPSAGDVAYLRRLLGLATNAAAVQFYMPIVCSGRLHPYVYAHGRVHRAEIVLI